jgi:hypothetical protein
LPTADWKQELQRAMQKSVVADTGMVGWGGGGAFTGSGIYVAPSTAGSMTYAANALVAGLGNQGH